MKVTAPLMLAIACLIAGGGCGNSKTGSQQVVKQKTTAQSVADDPNIPPERRAEIQKIIAQQEATHAAPPTASH